MVYYFEDKSENDQKILVDQSEHSVSMILMSHDLLQPIKIGSLGEIHTNYLQRDE